MRKVIYHKDQDQVDVLNKQRLLTVKHCILDATLSLLNPVMSKEDRVDLVNKKSKELLTQLHIPENMEEIEV